MMKLLFQRGLMQSIWATKDGSPGVFIEGVENAEFVVRRNFGTRMPVTGLSIHCHDNINVGVEVAYHELDETLSDRGLDTRRVFQPLKGEMVNLPFDFPCNDFSLTVVADSRPSEIVVKLNTADLNSFDWFIHPKNTIDFLRGI